MRLAFRDLLGLLWPAPESYVLGPHLNCYERTKDRVSTDVDDSARHCYRKLLRRADGDGLPFHLCGSDELRVVFFLRQDCIDHVSGAAGVARTASASVRSIGAAHR